MTNQPQPIDTHPQLIPMLEQLKDNARIEGSIIRTKDIAMQMSEDYDRRELAAERQSSFERLSEQLYLCH